MPEHGATAHISGYLHASSKTSEATVEKWLFDNRIIPGNTHWTPLEPGQNGDWRQHASMLAIFAACEDGCRNFEHWMQVIARNASREKDASRGRGKWRWRCCGLRRARPRPTAQPTCGGGVRLARTGNSAANPRQNASGSNAATVQQDECGLLAANP